MYRNVRSYGAVGDGSQDDTDSIQNAINTDGQGGNRYRNEVTTRPALIFVPGGEYKISKTVDLRLNTILVGDPNNLPVFKASAGFNPGASLINGYDFATDGTGGTTNVLVAIKNIVIDTTRQEQVCRCANLERRSGLPFDECQDTDAKKLQGAYRDCYRPGIDNYFDRCGRLSESLKYEVSADN